MNKREKEEQTPNEPGTPWHKAVREVSENLDKYLSAEEISELKELQESVIAELHTRGFSGADVKRFIEESTPTTLRSVGSWISRISEIMNKAYDKHSG
ncbi:MAG: hypothetical protein HYT12_04950 [Candidatus Liptonbacteria bacterium]|nr:hypothetical protein [Candidatus Liptonbacteria bacterium]